MSARRGWRERVEPGIYRSHLVSCKRSTDRRPGGCPKGKQCPWQIKVPGHSPGTTRMVGVTGSVREARAEKRRLMAEGRPQPDRDPMAAAETLDDFAASFFRTKKQTLAPNTIDGYFTDYRYRIGPKLGHVRLDEITRERIEVWKATLIEEIVAAGRSRRMIVHTVAVLRSILSEAVRWGRLSSNPARGLDLPSMETHETQAAEKTLTENQLAQLLTAGVTSLERDGGRLVRTESIIRVAAEAGLRRGEIAGLRWTDIDLPERWITVRRSAWEADGRSGVSPTKGRRTRKLPMSDGLAAALGAWAEVAITEEGHPADGWVWPGVSGDCMRTRSVWQVIRRALTRAGLVSTDGRPIVTVHGLRHTCGSLLLAQGVPLIVVSRILGHRDIQVTAHVYAHLLDEDAQLEAAVRVFDRLSTVSGGSPAGSAAP